MTGDNMLIFDGAKVDAMADALDRCAMRMRETTDQSRRIINDRIVGWVVDSSSRTAQVAFDSRLGGRIDEACETLSLGALALRRVADAGRNTESRVFAIVD